MSHLCSSSHILMKHFLNNKNSNSKEEFSTKQLGCVYIQFQGISYLVDLIPTDNRKLLISCNRSMLAIQDVESLEMLLRVYKTIFDFPLLRTGEDLSSAPFKRE